MNESNHWKVPKWPFLLADALLFGLAYFIAWQAQHPMARQAIAFCLGAAALGAVLGIVPFLLDYRAVLKLVDVNALGTVADKIQNLETLAGRIDAATNQWVNVQTQAEKISAGAQEIADRMAGEVRGFNEFQQRMNDSEKATLRLEVEKLHRSETEWLQVLVRILDHVFALHAAAVRSNQPQVAEQLTHFQNACRGTARRVGLVPFVAAADEPFDAERHQAMDAKTKPAPDAVVAETVGVGYTFQGRLVRPALVRLREERTAAPVAVEAPVESPAPTEPLPAGEGQDQLSLGTAD